MLRNITSALVASVALSFSPLSLAKNIAKTAQEAYVYGYPLVLTGITKDAMTNTQQPDLTVSPRAPINQFVHVPAFPDPTLKVVIRPNADTLYSTAWVDVSKEPMVLDLPDSNGRFYVMQMLDAWTDVFASPGKRTTGTKAGQYAIVGPNWKGALPTGVNKIQAPTNLVWIIGRTQANGKEDFANVNKFQDAIRLVPLSKLADKAYQPPKGVVNTKVDEKTPPPKQVEDMDAITFFQSFAEELKKNPPHKSDTKMVALIKELGIVPGESFDATKLSNDDINELNKAIKPALQQIKNATNKGGNITNGWLIRKENIGTYGDNYLARAAVALWALGANLPQDAIYPSTYVDGNGDPLTGKNKYVIHFDKNNIPPVNAFWSITLYDKEGYLVPNVKNKNAIGDRDKLQFNQDGSLDIYIQTESPGEGKETNWLPAPSDEFNLLMRLYWPKEAILNGKWVPPSVKKSS